jgi:hypothetical protein
MAAISHLLEMVVSSMDMVSRVGRSLLMGSAPRWSLLPVPTLDLLAGQPDGIRGRVFGLDREDLAIGRDLRLRDRPLLPLKLHDRDRVATIDLSDLHRLARWLAVD